MNVQNTRDRSPFTPFRGTERSERSVTHESDLHRLVTDAADVLGWEWVHFRPARTASGWRTPVQGPLGKGWPDLFLVRGERAIVAELKAEAGRVTDDQERVLGILEAAGIRVYTVRPSTADAFIEELR